ncbi:MAG: hypothetical protein DRN12_01110 [Thermoplasmata archaeon]|nr:MAG: hypothetical protein DRN12_01110 [Thermoplasmata archaeon]
MRKNDKIIIGIGIIVLLISSTLIYLWVPPSIEGEGINEEDIFSISGTYTDDLPSAIEVSSDNPFYALIATPLAIHYNKDGKQQVIPLYIKNLTNPSKAIIRAENIIGKPIDLIIKNSSKSIKNISLEIAERYWKKSKAALIIENNKEGYTLGIPATPIASYLSIPIIITNNIDEDITKTLDKLGVEYTIICGKNLTGYKNTLKFVNSNDILNFTIALVQKKFGDINYITLTNPLDAWPPKILDKKLYSSKVFETVSYATSMLLNALKGLATGRTYANFSFKIPDDYKYALVKIEIMNLDPDSVDKFGDYVGILSAGIDDPNEPMCYQTNELSSFGVASKGTPAIRDENGNIIKDRLYNEVLLYDRGGAKYNMVIFGEWLTKKVGRMQVNVEVDKLENPYYARMRGLSSTAPYLTAYRKGIIFAKPDFAFYADDNALTKKGETCPGFYSVRRNPRLAYAHNMHVFEKIHKPLNNLLAKLADIDLSERDGLRYLRDYYDRNPIYITIVGDAEMVPRIVYDNWLAPLEEDVDKITGAELGYGLGTPSDFIYGDIDPIYGDYSNLANDTYTYYPYQENIVGRFAGWDAQDVSAQMARTIFYYDILKKLGDWKNKAGLRVGGGQDFQRPPIRYTISRLTGNSEEAVKLPTGFSEISMERAKKTVLEPMGFNVTAAFDYKAQLAGFSEDALNELKKLNLLKRFTFFKNFVAKYVGDDVAKGKEIMENSNFLFVNAHGSPYLYGMVGPSILGLGVCGPIVKYLAERILSCIDGGFFGPGHAYQFIGSDEVRSVERLNMGPSVMWLDSCLCGKIGGVYPKNSISLALLHAGVNALISSSTESNIAGGYLEPKKRLYDTPWSVAKARAIASMNAKREIYPDPHFGYLLYKDMCSELMKNETIGLAFRNARNIYLPEDANSTFWWSPPLISTDNPLLDLSLQKRIDEGYKEMGIHQKSRVIKNKYFEFQEWCLYGDPAFNPYIPYEK